MGGDVWASGAANEPYVGRWSRLVSTEFVRWLDVSAGGRWLDVGCGTGAVTDSILRVCSPAMVVGLDPSDGYAQYARGHVTDSRVGFVVGTATALPISAAALLDPLSGAVQTAYRRRSRVTYVGETGEASAILRRKGVDTLQRSETTSVSFIGPGSVTNGDFGLFRWNMTAQAGGAGTHFHRTFSESFYVLAGAVTLFDGTGWVRAGEGDLLYVPPGGVHGFRNDSGADASMLILFSPGIPREKYFQELAEITRSGRTLTDEEWADLFARHDQVNV